MNKVVIALASLSIVAIAFAQNKPCCHANKPKPVCGNSNMYKELTDFLGERKTEFDQIDPERKVLLEKLSDYISKQRKADKPVRLIFVCTHNSRRSHMSQLWAAAAAKLYGIPVTTYSGGTETTAFNPRAVAAMERAGFKIRKTTEDNNPIYHVRYNEKCPAMTCFSKKYDNAPNPKNEYAAIMVCSSADKACPAVPGANARFAIPFVDPKVSDNSPKEAATYDERCAQIARELMYVMSKVSK